MVGGVPYYLPPGGLLSPGSPQKVLRAPPGQPLPTDKPPRAPTSTEAAAWHLPAFSVQPSHSASLGAPHVEHQTIYSSLKIAKGHKRAQICIIMSRESPKRQHMASRGGRECRQCLAMQMGYTMPWECSGMPGRTQVVAGRWQFPSAHSPRLQQAGLSEHQHEHRGSPDLGLVAAGHGLSPSSRTQGLLG